ncbi:MAG: asparagine synthase (glutamine-hydrolyzing), partial [Syntrophobacteraceae bacterium]
MCGIFGFRGKIEQELGLKCLRTLAHRGPDGEGIYQTDGIFLGHRRLAILDLSERGKQPMSYAEGRYWITFNGEIYNFVELKKDLAAKGYRFKSESDTELVLAAYVEWGEKCLDKFNGMWAFAIWDGEKKELFLSRDRFGKKPLFYSFINGDFVFASEMKAIAPLLERIEPNTDIILDSSCMFRYESTDKCLIKGIKRFPGGNYGRLKDGKLGLVEYWNTLDNIVDVPSTYEEQTERVRELFLDACMIRMRSDVPIGTALSGGLDSSAVFCALNHLSANQSGDRVARDWQHAFCASFPGTPLDEVEWAKKVAAHCGAKIDIIEIDPIKYLESFLDHTYLFEELYIVPHIPFVATYKEMRNHGVVVTIDGHGSDELFGGYHFDYLDILSDNMFNLRNSLMVIDT